MSQPKRHAIINFAPDWPISVEEAMERESKGFLGVGNHPRQSNYYGRMQDVSCALKMVAFRHLQFEGAPEAGRWIDAGFDCALHYFLDEWRSEGSGGHDMVIARKERDADVFWYTAFSSGLLLGLLSGRRSDVARLCDWPWVVLEPDKFGMVDDLEDEVVLMYIVLAAGLRSDAMEGVDGLKAKIRKCRPKRPRLLMALWDTVEAGDQPAFDLALRRSLEHFTTGLRLSAEYAAVAERLALPQSTIANAALWRGMRLPELPDELSAYLITRASLGLDA